MLGAWRIVIIASVVGAAVLAAHRIASAHAMLVSAEPTPDSVALTSPPRIRLVFSEQVEPSFATVSLIHDDGSVEQLGVSGDPHDVDAIIAPLHGLRTGAYRVSWRVVSADGHPVGGSYAFWVGAKGSAAPNASTDRGAASVAWGPSIEGAPAIPALLRGLALGSAMTFTGMLLLFCWPRGERGVISPRVKRVMRWLALATPLFLALHASAWVVHASPVHRLATETLAAALRSGVGRIELWRVVLSVLAMWALLIMRRPRVALLLALALVTLSGATGHSAAIQPLQATPAKALHLVAASAWLGGLCWLLAWERTDGSLFGEEALRVSSLALWSVVAVAVSGALMAVLFLSSPRDLLDSAYGAIMLAKILGFIALIGFGAYHRYRVVPLLQDGRARTGFAGSLRREIALMAVVVLLGGLLAYISPPGASIVAHPPVDSSVE